MALRASIFLTCLGIHLGARMDANEHDALLESTGSALEEARLNNSDAMGGVFQTFLHNMATGATINAIRALELRLGFVPSKAGQVVLSKPEDDRWNFEGKCPLHNYDERQNMAFAVGGRPNMVYQRQSELRLWIWSDGETRPLNPATDRSLQHERKWHLSLSSWGRQVERLTKFLLGTLIATSGNTGPNRTAWFMHAAMANCWQPAPLVLGPMIFTYNSVVERLNNPAQVRGFYAATSPMSETFFAKSVQIFVSGDPHKKVRQLYKEARLAWKYPIDADIVRAVPEDASEIEGLVPVLSAVIFGKKAEGGAASAMISYGAVGAYGIFGKALLDNMGNVAGGVFSLYMKRLRRSIQEWAKSTPLMEDFKAARKKVAGIPLADDQLMNDAADGAMFAGLGGTSDMLKKCLYNVRNEPGHEEMFKDHPERYLIELMRIDSAVTSVTELLRENEVMVMSGRNLTMGVGTPTQLVLATANHDPAKWIEPKEFKPYRTDLKDMVAWNGRVEDVEARDETKAPRGCPGHCASIKLAAAVCSQMTGSFEELLKAGKVGGQIECKNFS